LALIQTAEECLELAIEECRPGNLWETSAPLFSSTRRALVYSVVRDYVGHGIGPRMHEDRKYRITVSLVKVQKLRSGYVFAVEPMINKGTHHTKFWRMLGPS